MTVCYVLPSHTRTLSLLTKAGVINIPAVTSTQYMPVHTVEVGGRVSGCLGIWAWS